MDWVQVREPDLAARRLLALAGEAVRLSASLTPAARVLVNDRLDVAIATEAAGVHLGGESLPVEDVVRWRGRGDGRPDFLIGVSCHSLVAVERAEWAGADYVFFGPIFDTPSKRNFGAPQGLARLGAICSAVKIPVIAIGGITATNAADCVQAGARGIAAIRLFQDAVDASSVRGLVSQLHGLRG